MTPRAWNSTLPAPTKRLEQKTPLPKRNPSRRARLFERHFHSVARVEWVNESVCWGCGTPGRTQNAHAIPRSRGGLAVHVLPLCGDDPRTGTVGCHTLYDAHRHPWLTQDEAVELAAELHWIWEGL